MLPELAGRNLGFEHLVDLGRGSAANLWQDKVPNDARDGTRSSEAGRVSAAL